MNSLEKQLIKNLKEEIRQKQLDNLIMSTAYFEEFFPRKTIYTYLDKFIISCHNDENFSSLYDIVVAALENISDEELISNQLRMYAYSINISWGIISYYMDKDNDKSYIDCLSTDSICLKLISLMFIIKFFQLKNDNSSMLLNIDEIKYNSIKQNVIIYKSISNYKLIYFNKDINILRSFLNSMGYNSTNIKKIINVLKKYKEATSELQMCTKLQEGFIFETIIDSSTLSEYVIKYFEKENAKKICKFSNMEVKCQFINYSSYFLDRKVITPTKGVILKINSDTNLESILVKEAYNEYIAFIYGVVKYKDGKEYPYSICLNEHTSFLFQFENSNLVIAALTDFYKINDKLMLSNKLPNFKYEVISPYYWRYRDYNYTKNVFSREKFSCIQDNYKYEEIEETKHIGHFIRRCNGETSQKAKDFAKMVRVNLEPGYTIVRDYERVYIKKFNPGEIRKDDFCRDLKK